MNLMVINSSKEWGGTEKLVLYAAFGLARLGHKVYFGCRGDLFQKRALGGDVQFVTFPFANNIDVFTLCSLNAFF